MGHLPLFHQYAAPDGLAVTAITFKRDLGAESWKVALCG